MVYFLCEMASGPMELSFLVKYESGKTPFLSLDGYYGSQSVHGLIQVILISLHAYIHREIITRAPSAKGFHLVLGASRRGSWEQIITLAIYRPECPSHHGRAGD